MIFMILSIAGGGEQDGLGHQEDIVLVERPGAGGDKHCSSP